MVDITKHKDLDTAHLHIPKAHKASHQDAGDDEISIAGLSGEAADNQPPKTHATSHTDSSDDIRDATNALKGLATAAQITKLEGIEASADVNNISDVDATDLTDGGETALHSHAGVGGGAGKAVLELLPGSFVLPNDDYARLQKIPRTNSGPDNAVKFLADASGSNDEYATRPKALPHFYQGGALTITVYSLVPTAELASTKAKIYVEVNAIAHGEAWDANYTSIGFVEINPTGTANQLLVDTIAWASNLPIAGDMLKFKVYVDRSASDFIVGDKEVHVLSIKIEED